MSADQEDLQGTRWRVGQSGDAGRGHPFGNDRFVLTVAKWLTPGCIRTINDVDELIPTMKPSIRLSQLAFAVFKV